MLEAYDPCFLLPILSDLVKSGKSKSQGLKTTQLSCYKKFIMGNMRLLNGFSINLGQVGVNLNWFDVWNCKKLVLLDFINFMLDCLNMKC